MKMGATMKLALQVAQKLGGTVEDLPRKKTLDICFPSGRRVRVMKSDRMAPRNLVAAIKVETKILLGPPPSVKPQREEKRAKAKPSQPNPRKRSSLGRALPLSVRGAAHHVAGEIVVCRMISNGQRTTQPAVIVETGAPQHTVFGLTSRCHYADGTARHRVPNPEGCGLAAGTCIWSPKASQCIRSDVIGHVGWADQSLQDLIEKIRV
jgi:hypothetical protein